MRQHEIHIGAVYELLRTGIMANPSVWDRYNTKILLFVAIMSTGAVWGGRISEGKFSDWDALHLVFVFGLVYNLYSTCKKLSKENERLKQDLTLLKSKDQTSR
jgi:hypothetical protein